MPARDLPTGFHAGKRVKLEGTTYQAGDAIPNEVVNRVHHLSALLSNGMIKPDNDVYRRRKATKPLAQHSPEWYSQSERRSFPA